jgi:hypothetical protein
MKKSIKSAFLDLPQEKLALYVQDLIPRCEAQPELAVVQSQLDAVKAAGVDFDVRLREAVQGGRDRITLKNQALDVLLDKLDHLVASLEAARLPREALLRAGFELAGPKSSYAGSELSPPELRSVKALGEGTVELKFAHPGNRLVTMHLVDWSADDGVTWHSGTFGKRSPVRLKGLPALQKVLIRMRSVGTHGRGSDWTPATSVIVL